MMTNKATSSVVVFCASSATIAPTYLDAATALGKQLASNGIDCITGAGKQGLMGAINDSVLASGGTAIGVIPQFMVDAGWCHSGLSELVITETMHARKAWMNEHADVAIALPGGMGTLEELAEVLTWRQLGLTYNPVIILNINGYYDALLAFFDTMIAENFMRSNYKQL